MRTMTFEQLRERVFPRNSESELRKVCGGRTVISADDVLTSDRPGEEKLWLLLDERVLRPDLLAQFSLKLAERSLEVFDEEIGNDPRPGQAVEVYRRFLKGEVSEAERETARALIDGACVLQAEGVSIRAVGSVKVIWAAGIIHPVSAARFASQEALQVASSALREVHWQLKTLVALKDSKSFSSGDDGSLGPERSRSNGPHPRTGGATCHCWISNSTDYELDWQGPNALNHTKVISIKDTILGGVQRESLFLTAEDTSNGCNQGTQGQITYAIGSTGWLLVIKWNSPFLLICPQVGLNPYFYALLQPSSEDATSTVACRVENWPFEMSQSYFGCQGVSQPQQPAPAITLLELGEVKPDLTPAGELEPLSEGNLPCFIGNRSNNMPGPTAGPMTLNDVEIPAASMVGPACPPGAMQTIPTWQEGEPYALAINSTGMAGRVDYNLPNGEIFRVTWKANDASSFNGWVLNSSGAYNVSHTNFSNRTIITIETAGA